MSAVYDPPVNRTRQLELCLFLFLPYQTRLTVPVSARNVPAESTRPRLTAKLYARPHCNSCLFFRLSSLSNPAYLSFSVIGLCVSFSNGSSRSVEIHTTGTHRFPPSARSLAQRSRQERTRSLSLISEDLNALAQKRPRPEEAFTVIPGNVLLHYHLTLPRQTFPSRSTELYTTSRVNACVSRKQSTSVVPFFSLIKHSLLFFQSDPNGPREARLRPPQRVRLPHQETPSCLASASEN
jgi:hypothetical protein